MAAGTLEDTEDDDDLPHLGEMVGRPCRMWLNNNALPVPDPITLLHDAGPSSNMMVA